GSDASTDNTNKILEELSSLNNCLTYLLFKNRKGKSAIINELARLSDAEILIITDANVMLGPGRNSKRCRVGPGEARTIGSSPRAATLQSSCSRNKTR
ncbi:MAG: glycosyltransferase, partial [Pirellulaceae bacterium]